MENELLKCTPSEFVALTNQTLEYAYPSIAIEGEVASFKINQQKYVFFDLKDSEATVGCFMSVYQLRIAIEDGMRVVVVASPKLTQWGRFSLTVRSIRPSGEGSIKKSFELLRAKLAEEGLFALERKRVLPSMPSHLGVISSTGAAGYADFIKILDDRWAGLQVDVAHVQVQGDVAADQMIRALRYFSELEEPPQVVALIRGGGSADDLAVFNDEKLVRAVAASRVPVIAGIGHEVDESLVDLAADVRAATPSNAAQLLVPDKQAIRNDVRRLVTGLAPRMERETDTLRHEVHAMMTGALAQTSVAVERYEWQRDGLAEQLRAFDPTRVLQRGYAIVRGEPRVGAKIELETKQAIIQAEVTHVTSK